MNGFVILNKGEGVTSFRAAACLRRIFSEKKTGHTGTLDPMATGVLPVALGKATRFIDFIPATDKGYRAKLRFGITTDTLDITGKILHKKDVKVSREDILGVLGSFSGEIMQLPPMYSAISKDGVRLYELARQGIEVEREKRAVNIKKLLLTEYENDGEFQIDVLCSKGTYIRSLISDIGEALGTGACMTELQRTLSNGFTLNDAKTEEELEKEGESAVLGIDYPFMCYPSVKVTSPQANRFRNGGELSADRLHTEIMPSVYRVYSPENVFLGLGEIKEDKTTLWAKRVIGNEN
ncbi:MAG: tRNA pseudouridine(55) synthase TruB [Ruminococcaceae bacterium]|nr:tRNA pseudouridine(55) synthase TruB [Oscillospiraceae bacterium]